MNKYLYHVKKSFAQCGYIIKNALKTHSARAKESRNIQCTLVNNVENFFDEYSIKIFFSKLKNAKGSSREWLKLYPSI